MSYSYDADPFDLASLLLSDETLGLPDEVQSVFVFAALKAILYWAKQTEHRNEEFEGKLTVFTHSFEKHCESIDNMETMARVSVTYNHAQFHP